MERFALNNIIQNKKRYFITKFSNNLRHWQGMESMERNHSSSPSSSYFQQRVNITQKKTSVKCEALHFINKILLKHKSLHNRFINLLNQTLRAGPSSRESKDKYIFNTLQAGALAKFFKIKRKKIKRKKKLLLNVIRNKSIPILFTYLKKSLAHKGKEKKKGIASYPRLSLLSARLSMQKKLG